MRQLSLLGLSVVAAALLTLSVQAQAALLNFTLTGAYNASWQLDSNPTPDDFVPFGFEVDNVTGTYDGVPGVASSLIFYTDVDGGGFLLNLTAGSETAVTDGPQLFDGTLASPIFKTGTFALTPHSGGGDGYSLTISPVRDTVSGVPEPSTWAMMLLGIGLVGGTLRHRRSATRVSFA